VQAFCAGQSFVFGPMQILAALNEVPFSGNLRLNAAISVYDCLALKVSSPSCCLLQQLSPAIAAAIAGDLKL
jgi:hypothetical protein